MYSAVDYSCELETIFIQSIWSDRDYWADQLWIYSNVSNQVYLDKISIHLGRLSVLNPT